MKSKKRIFAIIAIALTASLLMAFVDGFWQPPYWIKSAFKVVLFLLLPFGYSLWDKDIKLLSVFKFNKKGFKTALLLSIPLYILILGAYFLFRNIFSFSDITNALTGNAGVTRDNFIFVALYISFVNSLLEEFFFRGFVFLGLKKVWNNGSAYIFSAAVFALYHIAMMTGWFSPVLFVLAMAGLFTGGLIFNFLNSKSENIYTSWLVHMFANFAINTIGLILFGII